MRSSTIVVVLGLAIALFGAVVLIRGIAVPEKHEVEVLGVQVSATESKPIPAWAGASALVVGVVLTAGGLKSRRL